MGSVIRLPAKALGGRIDAGYYRPEYVANAKRLLNSSLECAELSALVSDGRRTLYFGTSTLDEEQAPDDWIPFLTSDDLGENGFFIETRARRRVLPSFLDDYPAGRLRSGELLVKVKGPNQTTAYVETVPEYPVMVSGTIWGGLVRKKVVDPHYLVAALSCPYAVTARTRLRTNLNVEFLGANDLLSLELPKPIHLAQRYIGDKVRQAERLRQRARRLEADVAAIHAKHIVLPVGINFAKRTRRLAARSLTERLDAHFYPSAVEQYFRQLSGTTWSLDRLSTSVINGQSQLESEEGVPQATVANLGRSFVEGALRTVKRPTDGARAIALHDLLLCNAAHNKSYIGRDVTYSQIEGSYPSTEVMVIRVDRAQVPASFIRQYLKTEIGYLQIQSTIRGITAHSYPGDVKLIEVPIPSVPNTEREAWFATDDKMLAAGRCADAAKVLTTVAMALIERLIDGHVTESDLVAAQKALDAGDRSADRAILQALRQTASDAKLLIPNLDGLYSLLDEPDRGDDV
jgi:type I restriction enzyme S subunit